MAMQQEIEAFVVQKQGRWAAPDVVALRRRLTRRGLLEDGADLGEALEAARTWFSASSAQLFVCGGRPCRQRSRDFPGLAKQVESYRGDAPLSVTMTECLGPCKQAPVATLRVGERCTMFAEVYEACDWEAVLDYAGRAASACTLLVDPDGAQSYVFDPVHQADAGSGRQRPLAFLIGHFAGEGRHADGSGGFHKEVIGSWEAGGRFIGLRMAVTYLLDDGRNDVHHALVLVGYNDVAGAYEARAYLDGATTRDYRLGLDGNRLVFEDRVPGHGVNAARARKVLVPQTGGYDEVLEVQAEDEAFSAYSTVELRSGGRGGPG